VESLRLAASRETLATLEGVAEDVLAAARVGSHVFEEKAELEADEVEVLEIVFAPKPEKR